ncbi:MAG: hypothetical protein R6U38_10335 [Desulfatiglandaceae bacterium]
MNMFEGNRDNSSITAAYPQKSHFCGRDTNGYRSRMGVTLQTDLNISGSAVVPNLETDVPLTKTLQDLRQTYTHRLEAEKGSLQA